MVRSIKKGEILQRIGDQATKMYMVNSGLLRSYTLDENGKEHIFMFAPEGWIIIDNVEVGSSAELFIDAIEDSEIEEFDKEVYFGQNIPDKLADNRIRRLVRRISVLQKRIIMLMSVTALERYEHFKLTYPQLVQRIPQKMIASYLGITPEALSKVKSENIRANMK